MVVKEALFNLPATIQVELIRHGMCISVCEWGYQEKIPSILSRDHLNTKRRMKLIKLWVKFETKWFKVEKTGPRGQLTTN